MRLAKTLSPRAPRAWTLARRVCALAAIAAALPAPAAMAGTATQDILGAKIPATVHIKSTTVTTKSTATTAPASAATTPAGTTPATTAPAATTTTPASTSAAGGAQPGTVAPGSTATTPASAATTATAPATSTPTGTTRAGSTTLVAVGRTKAKSKRLSAGVLALAILGALLAFGAIAWAVARWLALEPRWTVSLMYSLREANYRASATWAEFSDWARLGR
jgi:hypothetical protein